jgi:hypothetical protein
MTTKTRLFNIRITEEKHKKFKKLAEKNDVSMGAILNNYIDALIREEMDIIGMKNGRKTVKWEDPLEEIRSQYVKGVDF